MLKTKKIDGQTLRELQALDRLWKKRPDVYNLGWFRRDGDYQPYNPVPRKTRRMLKRLGEK